jgi:hypothetical protein
LRLLIIATRFARRVGEATVEVSAFFIGYPSDQLHSEIKEGYSFADCKSHPREIPPRAATRCSVEGSALGRLHALFRAHLKIIRLSGPPALK